jgi:hypothetical protein
MGRRIEPKTVRRPSKRDRSSGGRLFSGEVVQLLHLEHLSYPQLRALARIVRREGPGDGEWSCFAFRDPRCNPSRDQARWRQSEPVRRATPHASRG